MSTVNTTVNVNDGPATNTPGSYSVKAHYTDVDAGSAFGPFSTREQAEQCLLVVAARTDVKKAELVDNNST